MSIKEEVVKHLTIGESYRGWEIPYCGLGTVVFRKNGTEFKVHRGLEFQNNWMEDVWLEVKRKIDEFEDAIK